LEPWLAAQPQNRKKKQKKRKKEKRLNNTFLLGYFIRRCGWLPRKEYDRLSLSPLHPALV
jgi:hypothetical protein